jgi:Cft2 family RNA processing exonuclease
LLNDLANQEPSATEPPPIAGSRSNGADAHYAVFRALAGSLLRDEPLSHLTVPLDVLRVAVDIATDMLVRHAQTCQKKQHCKYFPPLLSRYRNVRPESLKALRDQIYKSLWVNDDHEFVAAVRQQVIDMYPEPSEFVKNASWLRDSELDELLTKHRETAPALLTAAIWAHRFSAAESERLFRMLTPLIEIRNRQSPNQSKSSRDKSANELRSKVTEARKAARLAERELEQFKDKTKARDRALRKATQDLSSLTKSHSVTTDALTKATSAVADLERKLQAKTEAIDMMSAADGALHDDFREAVMANRKLEVDRSQLVSELSETRRYLERTKQKLDAVPRGAQSVWDFIGAEEERINNQRLIVSGGDRIKADRLWERNRKLCNAFIESYPDFTKPRATRVKVKSTLRLRTLGGGAEVGKSCYLLEIGKNRILVDCGIQTKSGETRYPAIETIDRLDALVITHAHTDHIGWVPALVRKFPQLDIYCSEGTAALLPVMLDDCYRHYLRAKERERRILKFASRPSEVRDDYDEENVRRVAKLVITCRTGEPEVLPFGNSIITFFDAGHILGASSVLLETGTGRRVFISGDLSSFDQLTVDAASWPDAIDDVDLLLLESTYGNKQHGSFDDSRRELISFVNEVTARNGSVILASFGLGRAQELISALLIARTNGQLTTKAPIHVDGMIKQINPIYERYARFSIPKDSVDEVAGSLDRQNLLYAADTAPQIIVSTSGMLNGGPVMEYSKHLLHQSRHRIVLAGYQDEGAPSKALLELERTTGGPRKVRFKNEEGESDEFEAAMPAKLISLSSHADKPGLIHYSQKVKASTIALVHGEPRAQSDLAFFLKQAHPSAEIHVGDEEVDVR